MAVFNWDALNAEELKAALSAADPGQIAGLDTDYLLEYAAEDTDITWNFYQHILVPALDKFKAYADYHKEQMVSAITHNAIQQLLGIWIDVTYMEQYREKLLLLQEEQMAAIFNHKEIKAGIDSFNQAVLDNLLKSEPEVKYHKIPDRKPEPVKFTKEGQVSRKWKAWYTLEEEVERLTNDPVPLPRYVKFLEKVKDFKDKLALYPNLTDAEIKYYNLFSVKSPDDKRWLFYDALRMPVKVTVFNKHNPDAPKKPSVDESAMLGMGEIGKLFIDWQSSTKELQFIESLVSRLDEEDIFHPQFKIPGTYTGRLSGAGGFSMQILPKTAGFLEAFRPAPGHKLVDIDVSALEPVVLTELSRDTGLLSVYGPNASPYADIYLTVGSRLGNMGQPFRDCGYDYLNPTKEAVAKCKKENKNLRGIVKKLHLSASYGAGPGKICSALQLDGVDISYDAVKSMHTEYWNIFKDVKKYEAKLVSQWEKNGGWFLNGLGFPTCVAQDKLKDIMNRQVQGTGHTILTFLQKIIADDLAEAKIPYRPYVYDWHDQILLEVPDEYAARAFKIMEDAFAKMNFALQDGNTVVNFRGSGGVFVSIAESKVETYESIWRETR
jgi:hypothetical protein